MLTHTISPVKHGYMIQSQTLWLHDSKSNMIITWSKVIHYDNMIQSQTLWLCDPKSNIMTTWSKVKHYYYTLILWLPWLQTITITTYHVHHISCLYTQIFLRPFVTSKLSEFIISINYVQLMYKNKIWKTSFKISIGMINDMHIPANRHMFMSASICSAIATRSQWPDIMVTTHTWHTMPKTHGTSLIHN